MELNKNKSKIIFIKPKRYSSYKPLPNYIKGIEVVKSAKYLGIEIDEYLTFEFQIKHWEKKVELYMKRIRRLSWY